MFLTTAEFLPQHHAHRQQVLRIISAAQSRGQTRLAEMNQQVAGNLAKIITALEDDRHCRHLPRPRRHHPPHRRRLAEQNDE